MPSRPSVAASIDLGSGEWIADADITLWRLGGVSGTVIDDRGDPAVGVLVRVLSIVRVGGRDHLAVGPLAVTDDRGAYRVGGLPPGRYIAMAPRGVHPMALSASLADLRAAPILELGGELRGVDLRLRPISSQSISGSVEGPQDALAGLTLRLLADGLETLGPGSEVATAQVGIDGSFRFTGVPDGSFTIEAPAAMGDYSVGPVRVFYGPQLERPAGVSLRGSLLPSGTPGTSLVEGIARQTRHWARTRVTVNGNDVTSLIVHLQPTGALTVKTVVEIDPAHPRPPARPTAFLDPAAGEPSLGRPRLQSLLEQQTTALLTGILPGPYVFRTASRGWMIKSVMADGRDVTGSVFDATSGLPFSAATVTFTNAAPTLAGSIEQRGERTAAVIAFPVERDQWTDYGVVPNRIAAVLSSTSGAYRFASLSAGEYYVIAVPAAQHDSWSDADFLARASASAARVTLRWGETTTMPLRVVDVR